MIHSKQKKRGFTYIDLMVAIFIVAVISTMVIANFRAGEKSAQTKAALKQVISSVQSMRTNSVAGALYNGSYYPDGGYGVRFEVDDNSIIVFKSEVAGSGYVSGNELPGSGVNFGDVIINKLCGTELATFSQNPCATPDWQVISDDLEVVFESQNLINVYNGEGTDYEYIGGELLNESNGQRAYFYISTVTGLVAGEIFYE